MTPMEPNGVMEHRNKSEDRNVVPGPFTVTILADRHASIGDPMTTVSLKGWKGSGASRIPFIDLILEYTGYDMKIANESADRVLNGLWAIIEFSDAKRAAEFAAKAEQFCATVSKK